MSSNGNRVERGFLGATAWVFLGLVVPLQAYQWANGSYFVDGFLFWRWISTLVGDLGLLLPFSAFAGGIAVSRSFNPGRLLTRSVLVAAISFGVLAYASPLAKYQALVARGGDPSLTSPFGPRTLPVLIHTRSTILANPPDEYSFWSSKPLSTPPNWLTYLINEVVVFPLFAVLAALLGSVTGVLTTGLSPPARRNTRWAIGLATGLGFFLPSVWTGEWVRTDVAISGIAAAWLPVLVPVVELAVLWALLRSRTRRLQGP